jgi:glycosyltransferase involved in cell wall biosynthesis
LHFRDGAYVGLKRHVLRDPLKAFPHRSDEYDVVVAAWLMQFAIELVHIRHIAWHGLGLVDLAKALGLPLVFSFHDFYTVCPSVHLLDERDVYCAGRCTPTVGACRYALWGDRNLPPLKHAAVGDWQAQIGAMLARCDAFVTTSESAKQTLIDTYPFLGERPFSIIPHGRDFVTFEQASSPFDGNGAIRILVPGNLSASKGDAIVAELARRARAHRIELHVMGALSPRLTPPANFVYHGTYRRSEFAAKAKAIQPHLGGIFSIWAETYGHTLTELWASGIPVVGFDYGAIGERIRRSGAGWLASKPTPQSILEIIEGLRSEPADYARKLAAVHAWQRTEGQINDCAHMADAYLALYSAHLPGLTLDVDSD